MKKVAIVTGTSRGIGFELAQILANNNIFVIALSRNSEPLNKVQNNNIHSISVDLTVASEIDQVKEYLQSNNLKVNYLIHNAGALVNKPFTELTQNDFEKVYQVNVFSVAALTQAIIPFMPVNSHVVTISSMGGVQGSLKFPGLAAYSSSKGAVITLSELLAEEYKEQKIAFNVLALGAVQTETCKRKRRSNF